MKAATMSVQRVTTLAAVGGVAAGPQSALPEVDIFPKEWSTEDRECCPSGVVDVKGKCCYEEDVSPTVDAKGECCSAGYVDPCGVCGGDGKFLDVEGACCKVLHLAALSDTL